MSAPRPPDRIPVMPNDHLSRDELDRLIRETSSLLPLQGPIDVFVAQNMLHGFESRPFEEAVVEAAGVFGTEPFLPESVYREELARGRIRRADLEAVLDAELAGEGCEPLAAGRTTRRELLLALLEHPVHQEDDVAVRWLLTERETFRGDEASGLWHACMEGVSLLRPSLVHVQPPARPRDLILAADPTLDTDALVHPLLIRLCAAYLDQGVAAWPMPGRHLGFFEAAAAVLAVPFGPSEPWSARLPRVMAACAGREALDVAAAELGLLGAPKADQPEVTSRSLLALRGWAGMFHQLEQRPDRAPVVAVPARLADFLAIRLVLDRIATEWAARRLGHGRDLAGMWVELRDRYPPRRGAGSVARAYLLFQVSQLLGLGGSDIRGLDVDELMRLERAVHAFDAVTRRRLFHLAYERRHRIVTLDALAAHDRAGVPAAAVGRSMQVIVCMDDRCESFRRHLEEIEPSCETFGTAGFFFVPMSFHGLDDWHATPLCPIGVRPRHTVVEVPVAAAETRHHLRQIIRRQSGRVVQGVTSRGRTLLLGGVLSAVGGAVAAVPLVARVLFPRLTGSMARRSAELGRDRLQTRLVLERHDDQPLPDGTLPGFTVPEMVEIVRRLLEDIGLTSGFARLVALLGHGSSSLNNPHESAYDCGACGGGRGGPNARAFALMANDPRVRRSLTEAGIRIPEETVFIGGMHDTCSDALLLHDADRVPAGHLDDLARLRNCCDRARAADAQERCRRFDSVPLDVAPAEAVRRVEARASDLAQVRPELGHATNAVCIIGRRSRSRGLFLDRRAFLVSYDPDRDVDGAILARTLAAVGPVAAGINLAYTLSRIDPIGYGAGTKLPHNITGLIGVMDGHASDLRTGLPWQAVENHEPVRLLIVIEATAGRILEAAARVPVMERLIVNRWVQLAAWHEAGSGLSIFDNGRFVPYVTESSRIPEVRRSIDWFGGHRGHLPPARTLAAFSPGAP